MRAMIETRALRKTYGRVAALQEVTFAAQPGRVTGFLGLNGSGKTTTLRILLELVTATAGRALIDGRRYRGSASACSS
jgi:ABC-2 type transport system ATP-binding protein